MEIGQKSKLNAEQRMALVLRMLRKEEPAVQIARRAEIPEEMFRLGTEFV